MPGYFYRFRRVIRHLEIDSFFDDIESRKYAISSQKIQLRELELANKKTFITSFLESPEKTLATYIYLLANERWVTHIAANCGCEILDEERPTRGANVAHVVLLGTSRSARAIELVEIDVAIGENEVLLRNFHIIPLEYY